MRPVRMVNHAAAWSRDGAGRRVTRATPHRRPRPRPQRRHRRTLRTKVLADAGADVVKVEPAGGDPPAAMGLGGPVRVPERRRSARSTVGRGPGGRRRHPRRRRRASTSARCGAANPALVVVTVTPFGARRAVGGPPGHGVHPAGVCGSTGQRGLPEQPPLAAGGRIGEWVAGTYAAVVRARRAAGGAPQRRRRARRRGDARLHGGHDGDLPLRVRLARPAGRR